MSDKYYNLTRILSKHCDYNIVIGERSNGKTYAALLYGLYQYVAGNGCTAIIRRWQVDIAGKRAASMYDALEHNNEICKATNGDYTQVYYYAGRWYLANYDAKLNKLVHADEPFAFGFALSDVEHDKSISHPTITTIIFDEFLTRRNYLNDEFVIYMNVLSSIIRQRDNVRIIMLGNTVSKYCPYFNEMGLKHVTKMPQGSIDVYTYGTSGLKVAVEYAAPSGDLKPSNKYFAFDNPDLKMITSGAWELAIYPHLSIKYKPSDIVYIYFILYNEYILQCEIIQTPDAFLTYIHRKTTPIKDPHSALIYSLEPSEQPNYRIDLTAHITHLQAKIAAFYAMDKVFYQDNEIGEMVHDYIRQAAARCGRI